MIYYNPIVTAQRITISKRGKIMNIMQLQYFIETYQQKSMTKASKNLYITAPALCTSIKRVEEELGVTLFERSVHGLTSTLAGDLFYQTAQAMLGEYYDYKNAIQTDAKKNITIATFRFFSENALHNIYRVLSLNFPQYLFRMLTVSSIDTFTDAEQTIGRKIDIFVYVSEHDSLEKAKQQYQIPEEYAVKKIDTIVARIYLSKKHPIAKKKFISLQDIKQYPFIYPSTKSANKDIQGFLYWISDIEMDNDKIYIAETKEIFEDFLLNKQAITINYDIDEELKKYVTSRVFEKNNYSNLYVAYNTKTADRFYPIIAGLFLQ